MKQLQPPGWARPKGFANGVRVRGELVFVAGQVGWDEQCRFQTDDLVAQAAQAMKNVVAILAEAGARPEHIARMIWYLADKDEYMGRQEELGRVFREIIGTYGATMTAVQVAGFVEHGAKVEIEVMAVIPDS